MQRLIPFIFSFVFASCRNSPTQQTNIDKPQNVPIDTQAKILSKLKFATTVSFSEFNIDTLVGTKMPIDFTSNRPAERFKTQITSSYKSDGLNFAGHYNLASWGCGSPCQNGVLVDLKTGKIYELPPASLGYNFKQDSRLLIVNPPDSNGYYEDCFYCVPEIWVWNETKKRFEQ